MATPYKCPVCDGQGLVSKPPHIAGDQETWSDSQCAPYSCRACSGTGIIWDKSEQHLQVVYYRSTDCMVRPAYVYKYISGSLSLNI